MQPDAEDETAARRRAGRLTRRWLAAAIGCAAFAAYLTFTPSPVRPLWANVLSYAAAIALGLAVGGSLVELTPMPTRRGSFTSRRFWMTAAGYVAALCYLFLVPAAMEPLGRPVARHPADAKFTGQAISYLAVLIGLGAWRVIVGRGRSRRSNER